MVGELTDLIPEHPFSEGTTADQEAEGSGPSWGVPGDGKVKPTSPLFNAAGGRRGGAMGSVSWVDGEPAPWEKKMLGPGGDQESTLEYAELEGLWVSDDSKQLLFILLGLIIELKIV